MEENKKDGFYHNVTCKLLPRSDVRVSCLHIKYKILKKRIDINFYKRWMLLTAFDIFVE